MIKSPTKVKHSLRNRRRASIRRRLAVRACVRVSPCFRSNKHIYAQIIDDSKG